MDPVMKLASESKVPRTVEAIRLLIRGRDKLRKQSRVFNSSAHWHVYSTRKQRRNGEKLRGQKGYTGTFLHMLIQNREPYAALIAGKRLRSSTWTTCAARMTWWNG